MVWRLPPLQSSRPYPTYPLSSSSRAHIAVRSSLVWPAHPSITTRPRGEAKLNACDRLPALPTQSKIRGNPPRSKTSGPTMG